MKYFKTLILAITGALALVACSEGPQQAGQSPDAGEASDKAATQPNPNALTVYKSPSCGCCEQWVFHLKDNQFSPEVEDTDALAAIKVKHGIRPEYQSCHTAVEEQGGYVFEGHVPAHLIQQFLAAPPKGAIGLAVPGMPIGSPGMVMGNRFDDYDVLVLNKDGSSRVYAHIDASTSERLARQESEQ